MAFINPGTGFGKKQLNPAITPIEQLQPQLQMATPNQGKRAKVIQSNANAKRHNTPSGKPPGNRVGGKAKVNRYKDISLPVAMMPNRKGPKDKGTLKISNSDFGYDIRGTSTPNTFQDSRDVTFHRDYNVRSNVFYQNDGFRKNDMTTSIKLMDISLEENLTNNEGYGEAYDTIINSITRDFSKNTKNAKGAMDLLPFIRGYFNVVSRGFDILIELEALQAFGPEPSQREYYNRSFRAAAEMASVSEISEYRNKLRRAMVPHVLPVEWMEYLKWIRTTKRVSEAPQSTKLRFISSDMASLVNDLFTGQQADSWIAVVNATIQSLNGLNPQLPGTLIYNVDSVDLRNANEYYQTVHNSSSYDLDFNDIWNNRVIYWSKGGDIFKYPNIPALQPCYAAFSSNTPISMAVAALDRQRGGHGLPLESAPKLFVADNQFLGHNTFQIVEEWNSTTGSKFKLVGVEEWFRYNDNSVHIADMNAQTGVLNHAVSGPHGDSVVAYTADTSNIQMAARESFSKMTLINC